MRRGNGDRRVELRDGSSVALRPLSPYDRERLARAVERMSEDSRYRRFHTPLPRLTRAQLDYLIDIDHSDHEAIAALDADGDIVGVARYVRLDDPGVADAAVAVGDHLQGQGLGRALLQRLVERARDEGIGVFTAMVQADNPAAIGALTRLGRTSRTAAGSEVELRIELPERPEVSGDLERALRSAAAGSLVTAGALLGRLADAARYRRHRRPPPHGGRLETIVAGTDGSETAGRALHTARDLAGALGATLHLVTAAASSVESRLRRAAGAVAASGDVAAGGSEPPLRAAERLLEEAASRAAASGLEPVSHLRREDPASALITVAEEQDADLIVVGNRGMAGSRRSLLGNVPNKVSHHAPCSVLIVRSD